ncbi:hypothetical protein [Kribbella hippodromi]
MGSAPERERVEAYGVSGMHYPSNCRLSDLHINHNSRLSTIAP